MQDVTSDLANGLMAADSAAGFLTERRGRIDWHEIASIKTEVDRLSGCDLKRATQLADRLSELSRLIGDPLSEAFAEASRARVLDNMGRHAEANELYDKAAATMQASGLKTESAIIRKQQLHALIQLGRYRSALRTAGSARRVLLRADPIQLAQLEANIGNIYYRLDRYRQALAHYDRAREALSRHGDETMLAVIDFSRSSVFAELDQPDKALELLEKSAAQFDRAGRLLQAEQARFHIAYLHFLRGNYNLALAGYDRARDRLSDLGSDELAAYCSLNMGDVLLALNAFEDAADTAFAARTIFDDLRMPFESARARLVGGLTTMGLRHFDNARTELTKAREAFEKCGNAIFTAIADSYLAELAGKTGDFVEMADRAGSSLRVFSRNGLSIRSAYSRLLMARAAYELQDSSKAARMARNALRSVEGKLAPGVTYQAYHLLGCVQRDRNRRTALDDFRRAVEAIEQMREWIVADEFKARFLQDKIEVYEDAIAACLDYGPEESVKEAFRFIEASKSRALADLLARYQGGSDEHKARIPEASKNQRQVLKLVEDLNWYLSQARIEEEKGKERTESALERYRAAALRCERRIKQLFSRMESADYDRDVRHMKPATEADLQSILQPDETAVEFFMTRGDLGAFIVSPRSVQVVRSLTSRRAVDLSISALRFQLDKFTYDPAYLETHRDNLRETTNQHLQRLYREIFAPIEKSIAGKRLIVVPHGALHYLPFPALYDGAGYLIDRFEISYAPSTAVLRLCRSRGSKPGAGIRSTKSRRSRKLDLLALGLPDEEAPQIGDEIGMVTSVFPDSVELLGDLATRANLVRLGPGARFIHISSHGSFRRDNPMFSFLKLADCRLNFYSLLDLRLKAEMVTLSACQTGVNALLPGDELHGLMRGFLYAGATALTVSLWKVADRSTAALMAQMYRNIKAGQTKRAALRSAQLAIKGSYDHPYYWAPFVLMGSPD